MCFMLWCVGAVCSGNTEEGNDIHSGGISRKAAQVRGSRV